MSGTYKGRARCLETGESSWRFSCYSIGITCA